MMKKKTTTKVATKKAVASKLQFADPITEVKHAKRIRKISFSQTCEKIEAWGRNAATAYLDGKQPTQDQIYWLVSLVKELSTGTNETRRIEFTILRIAQLVGLETKSMTRFVKEWKPAITPQSGQRMAQYDLMDNLPTLKNQFPHVDEDDWNALIAESL